MAAPQGHFRTRKQGGKASAPSPCMPSLNPDQSGTCLEDGQLHDYLVQILWREKKSSVGGKVKQNIHVEATPISS